MIAFSKYSMRMYKFYSLAIFISMKNSVKINIFLLGKRRYLKARTWIATKEELGHYGGQS